MAGECWRIEHSDSRASERTPLATSPHTARACHQRPKLVLVRKTSSSASAKLVSEKGAIGSTGARAPAAHTTAATPAITVTTGQRFWSMRDVVAVKRWRR